MRQLPQMFIFAQFIDTVRYLGTRLKSRNIPRRLAGRPRTAHLLRWQLVDITPTPGSSISLPPCICTVLERSLIQQ